MNELDKISQNITEQLGVPFAYYREDAVRKDVPFCDRHNGRRRARIFPFFL